MNIQPFQLVVIHTADREAELLQIYRKKWFVQAPIVICACGIAGKSWVRKDGRNYNDVDVAIVMDHLILAATAEGLGTCWVGAFDEGGVSGVLGLPSHVRPMAIILVGTADENPKPPPRRAIEEFTHLERYGQRGQLS